MRRTHETTARRAWLALAAGVVLAVVLVVAAVAIQASMQEVAAASAGRHLLFPVALQAFVAAGFATEAALIVALVSAPIWWGLERAGQGGLPSAVALGFLATMAYWLAEGVRTVADIPEVVAGGLLWSAFGAVSASVTWMLAYRRVAVRSSTAE